MPSKRQLSFAVVKPNVAVHPDRSLPSHTTDKILQPPIWETWASAVRSDGIL